jgi:hypothetical protein
MVLTCDENARREIASYNSLMDPSGKKEEGTTIGGHGGTASQRQ